MKMWGVLWRCAWNFLLLTEVLILFDLEDDELQRNCLGVG